jgi:hypothetical protein
MSTTRRDDDFAARIATALEAEATPQVRRRHWAQYVGGGALAAGVAVAALMLNAPNSRVAEPAPMVQNRAVPSSAGATALAANAAAANPVSPPWLLSRQPTVLTAQPASANVVYGTGLMQPDYLRRAAYAEDGSVSQFISSYRGGSATLPFSIVLLPAPASSTASARH